MKKNIASLLLAIIAMTSFASNSEQSISMISFAEATPIYATFNDMTVSSPSTAGIMQGNMELYYQGRFIGYIRSDGDVFINGSRVGMIRSDGDIFVNGSRTGQIRSNGDVFKNGSRIGEIRSNGDIFENGSRVGEVRTNGDIFKNGSYVGNVKNMSNTQWAAVIYFFNFFKF